MSIIPIYKHSGIDFSLQRGDESKLQVTSV